jgi:hypothetical protein
MPFAVTCQLRWPSPEETRRWERGRRRGGGRGRGFRRRREVALGGISFLERGFVGRFEEAAFGREDWRVSGHSGRHRRSCARRGLVDRADEHAHRRGTHRHQALAADYNLFRPHSTHGGPAPDAVRLNHASGRLRHPDATAGDTDPLSAPRALPMIEGPEGSRSGCPDVVENIWPVVARIPKQMCDNFRDFGLLTLTPSWRDRRGLSRRGRFRARSSALR